MGGRSPRAGVSACVSPAEVAGLGGLWRQAQETNEAPKGRLKSALSGSVVLVRDRSLIMTASPFADDWGTDSTAGADSALCPGADLVFH